MVNGVGYVDFRLRLCVSVGTVLCLHALAVGLFALTFASALLSCLQDKPKVFSCKHHFSFPYYRCASVDFGLLDGHQLSGGHNTM